ncbi:hypothetical protein BKA70DRAFT_1148288 [Coprinopsis sp. MPI-PUGE-AT-0042]|nr:hypothetical protein BKA70DRAFT_1148288 [Coprinopsis sp. MPI-PUGE-AT-0042]
MGGVVSQNLWGVQVTNGPLNIAAGNVHNHYHRADATSDIPPILESVPNFRAIHIATLGRATPGTGLWIVECETFRLWLDPDGWLRIMWGYGMPGAGKTIAASIVINALEAHASNSSLPICVCYVYFRYSDHAEATTRSFLEVIVKQTLERHPGCLPLFNQTYVRHIREKTQPTKEELLGLLRHFTGTLVTFYVLDALDEAPTAIQIEIIQALTSLNVKLFITSRPLKIVEAAFPNVHRFPIVAQTEDIDLHIDQAISRSGDLRAILEQGGPSLRSNVYSSIKAKCGGMFLHATLQLATLRECTSVHEVKETLASFPTDIEDLYHKTWQRILAQAPGKVLLARNVLTWVLFATRSLNIQELRAAVATCPSTHQFVPDRLVQESVLTGVCHGLVIVEEQTRVVRLVHYTAKDTLKRLITETSPQPHALLSAVCLARLTSSGFQRKSFTYQWELRSALQAEALLSYAYDSWSIHARQSLDDPLTTGRLAEFAQNCRAFPFQHNSWGTNMDTLGPLHLLACFSLPIAFAGSDNLRNPNQCTQMRKGTALHLACMQGHDDAVTELLHLPGLAVNAVDIRRVTPLMLASTYGHEGVIRVAPALPNVDVNSLQHGQTALSVSSRNAYKRTVALLLSHPDIDVNMADDVRFTVLIKASALGHQEIVMLLLSHPGIDVNARSWLKRTALGWASLNGHEETVKLLLSHPQVDVNVEAVGGHSPLGRAAMDGREGIVKLLLTHPSIQVGTRELEAARSEGHQNIVCLLEEFLGRS